MRMRITGNEGEKMEVKEAIEVIEYARAFNVKNTRITTALDIAIRALQKQEKRSKAVEDLIALACCSIPELRCCDCPRVDEESGTKCSPWNEYDIISAVKTLKGGKET